MSAAATGSPAGQDAPRLRSRPVRARRLRLHPAGLVGATTWAMLAMTPSLIPRDWVFQGLVSGFSAAVGYGVGVVFAWLARRMPWWRRSWWAVRRRVPRWAHLCVWCTVLLAALVGPLTMLVVAASWQRDLAGLVGMERPTTGGWLRAWPLTVVVAGLLLTAARGVGWLARSVSRLLRRWRWLPGWAAAATGAVVAALVVSTLVRDVLLIRVLSAADSAFSTINAGTYPGVEQPQRSTRSGSPGSLVAWDSLGKEGRAFVTGGRPLNQLAEAGGRAPLDPIRVYVGLESAPTPQQQADVAVAELERTGAFDRSVVAVVTTTGTGWVNGLAPDSLEAMYAGDTAVVATQYSYLPSWLSFLVDHARAEQAARLLFSAVRARIEQLPEVDRPRLLVYGESLGAHGSQAAFPTLADIRAQADGVLWVGPPNASSLWSDLVRRRDRGTREVEPVYASGLVVRFAGARDDLTRPPTPWLPPRVLYLQHPSDPIVWWSPELLYRRPDWLAEPRGADVLPAMRWFPVVTFWQLTADLFNAQSVPDGHGHNYGDTILDGWVAVAAPDGWSDADTGRVRRVLISAGSGG